MHGRIILKFSDRMQSYPTAGADGAHSMSPACVDLSLAKYHDPLIGFQENIPLVIIV